MEHKQVLVERVPLIGKLDLLKQHLLLQLQMVKVIS
jgi:hypothetical protein